MFYCTFVLLLLVCLSAVVCFSVFFPDSFFCFSQFPKKGNSYFVKLLKWHLLCTSDLHWKLLHLFYPKCNSLFWSFLTFALLPSPFRARCRTGGRKSRKEPSTTWHWRGFRFSRLPTREQDGWGWVGLSDVSQYDRNTVDKSFSKVRQTHSETDDTYENLMLFPLSEPVTLQNAECYFLLTVEQSLPLESIMCKWFIKPIQLAVHRLQSSKTENLISIVWNRPCLTVVGRLSALCSSGAVVLTFGAINLPV